MGRQRVAGDYLQPSAIFDHDFRVLSGINDPNDYAGPGTGYRVGGARWEEIQALPQVRFAAISSPTSWARRWRLAELGPARPGSSNEVVVAVGPAFGTALTSTIGNLPHEDVLAAIDRRGQRGPDRADRQGLPQLGLRGDRPWRAIERLGVAIGMQSRGTTVMQKRGLPRLHNLELFPQSPSLTLETYRAIGRNAARYAKGLAVQPVPVQVDNWARLRLIVKTTLLHRETEQVRELPPMEWRFDWEPDV